MKILKFLIILITIFAPIHLQAEEKNSKLYEGEWISNCSSENEKQCVLERSVFIDKEMKQKLVTIAMQTKSNSDDVRFVLISPLGTVIPQGVKIGFDGKFISEKPYGFNICRQNGCITTMMVKDETLSKFQKGNEMNLEYVAPNGQKININLGLKGFSAEFKKIASN
jgi:invasion protein IalB